ncbi:CPBP family intramembrane glutamic endopeptidase [Curtobacterium sp. RIT-PI-V]|uniref:CPBP family intramembrane glutamic endopeptidase n=1 Tax=Curtobacterium sp. RIT-PI-V TaxID=3035296 RepID=UPI0021DB0E24|nr:CPBP family intramembrane glutamic endopeptidase [Curtobacterium sp. RIT-PI-V]
MVLLVFARSIGFVPRPLFGPQPVRGRWWMWAAPILLAAAAVFHLVGAPYSRYTPGVVVALLIAGLFIGFSEEILTRGLGVALLRRGGHKEWSVMVLSSLIFALLHLTNALSGQPIGTVLFTVVYTFGFGISMYLTMRVGGNLVWPMLLHAMTDPSTALAAGGIDESVSTGSNTALLIATIATFAYDAFAIVGFIATRGDAEGRADADEPRRARHDDPASPAVATN